MSVEQVFVVALVPLLFVFLGLLGFTLVLLLKHRLLRGRIASLKADIKTIHNESLERFDLLEARIKEIREKKP